MNNIKELTILHINDLHGQHQFTVGNDMIIRGGISLTSGYIRKVRETEKAVFLGICGDVLQEDILGSDYKGTNTVNLINHLNPDAASLGSHEMDYGLAHLLTFTNCINAPTLCANIMIGCLSISLFKPSMVFETDGIRILLIGVIPKAFLNKIMSDEFCQSMVEYRETYQAIREEIDKHKHEHIDLVVLMSHYGIEGDRKLAENMPEDIHADIILGGHSHIDMDEAETVNNIVIAQSSYGTGFIGRFDLKIDCEEKKLLSWTWKRVELSEKNAEFDSRIDELADTIVFRKKKVSADCVLCEFDKKYEHKSRLYETDIGNIIADAFLDMYSPDMVILQSGSIRLPECGTVVTEKVFKQLYPFDDKYLIVELRGKEIKDSFDYLFSLKPDGSVMNGTFQYSRGFCLEADAEDCWNKGCRVTKLTLNGKEFEDEKIYRVGMTKNCADSSLKYFGLNIDSDRKSIVSFSSYSDLARWFMMYQGKITAPEKGRFIFYNFEG